MSEPSPPVPLVAPQPDAPRRKVRVLFGCAGWPSGVLEVGSWAKHQALAEVAIFQIQPGRLFCLDADDWPYLTPGPVDPEIVEAFQRRGRRLSGDACVTVVDARTREICDRRREHVYRVVASDGEPEVLLPAQLDDPRFDHSAREALRVLGGSFLGKLLEFRPHVVGFRVEGSFREVRRYIAAVRQFAECEIVLGGPTATSHPAELLVESGADYVFAGEAEETFAQFLRLAGERNSTDRQPEIAGLAYRYGGRVYFNTLPGDGYEQTAIDRGMLRGRPLREAQNARRPVAGNELLAANRLDWSLLESFGTEFDSLFFTGGRGCPGECTFCALLHGQTVRTKSAAQILEEIAAADARVRDGTLRLSRWDLFKHCDDPALRELEVSWAAIFDEDFFLNRRRANEFFRLWSESPLRLRYRLSVQTNPLSLVKTDGTPHEETFAWIDRLKPMIQLGAESFHPDVLARWHKRHTLPQLNTVLDALDRTRQDYTVFQLLTDQDTTLEELLESLRLLILNGYRRRRMRIAASAFTIPLYDTDARRLLEFRGDITPERIRHFTDYETPQPGWMDPLVAELADLADSELQFTLIPEQRDGALRQTFEAVVERIDEHRLAVDASLDPLESQRLELLSRQAHAILAELRDAQFAHALDAPLPPSGPGGMPERPCQTIC